MGTKEELRENIIERIHALSEDKLDSLEAFLNSLEKNKLSRSEILSFAGIFKDLDGEVLNDLTINLPQHRQSGSSRIK